MKEKSVAAVAWINFLVPTSGDAGTDARAIARTGWTESAGIESAREHTVLSAHHVPVSGTKALRPVTDPLVAGVHHHLLHHPLVSDAGSADENPADVNKFWDLKYDWIFLWERSVALLADRVCDESEVFSETAMEGTVFWSLNSIKTVKRIDSWSHAAPANSPKCFSLAARTTLSASFLSEKLPSRTHFRPSII